MRLPSPLLLPLPASACGLGSRWRMSSETRVGELWLAFPVTSETSLSAPSLDVPASSLKASAALSVVVPRPPTPFLSPGATCGSCVLCQSGVHGQLVCPPLPGRPPFHIPTTFRLPNQVLTHRFMAQAFQPWQLCLGALDPSSASTCLDGRRG